MRFALLPLLLVFSSCVTVPNYQFLRGGETVKQSGVSFVLPEGKSWIALMRSTYESALGASQMPKNETLMVNSLVYNAPAITNKQEFLEAIKKGRSSDPQTGRFEIIRNSEALYEARPETCVVYQSASKDFGAEAKRGGEYSIFETFGMICIHPANPKVQIRVELSRKAPPDTTFPEFDAMAQALLRSVAFDAF